MRYPSNLISCSHSGPRGGASTILQSSGLTHVGRPGEWLGASSSLDFAVSAREAVVSILRQICEGDLIDMPGKMKLQLAATHALAAAVKTVDLVHKAVGTTGIRYRQISAGISGAGATRRCTKPAREFWST